MRITRGRNNVVACNGIYPTPVILIDEFKRGTTASGSIGELGWTINNGATVTIRNDEQGHPGIFRLTSPAAVGVSGWWLDNTYNKLLDPAYYFDITFVLRFESSLMNVEYSFGLTAEDATQFNPTSGIYFQKVAASSAWVGVCRASSTSATTSSVETFDSNWHEFRIRRMLDDGELPPLGRIGFSIDGGTERSASTHIPTARLNPFIVISNTNTNTNRIDIDYFDLKLGLAR